MEFKNRFVINDSDKDNVKIFDLEKDRMINLNEQASLIFLNLERSTEYIKTLFMDLYTIEDEEQLVLDIEKTKNSLKQELCDE